MEKLERTVESFLDELEAYMNIKSLTEDELDKLRGQLDKLLYSCMYYKMKLT